MLNSIKDVATLPNAAPGSLRGLPACVPHQDAGRRADRSLYPGHGGHLHPPGNAASAAATAYTIAKRTGSMFNSISNCTLPFRTPGGAGGHDGTPTNSPYKRSRPQSPATGGAGSAHPAATPHYGAYHPEPQRYPVPVGSMYRTPFQQVGMGLQVCG